MRDEEAQGRFCLAHVGAGEQVCPCCEAVEERRLREAAEQQRDAWRGLFSRAEQFRVEEARRAIKLEATLDKLLEPLTDEECQALAEAWDGELHDGFADVVAVVREFLRLRGVEP